MTNPINRLKIVYCLFFLSLALSGLGQDRRLSRNPHAWHADWISPPFHEDSIHPCPVFQKTFLLAPDFRSATLRITAHGLYEARINGKRVGEAYFTPGYTSYDHRLQYQDYDITKLLHAGDNRITVTIGDGWYRGIFGGDLHNNNYGSDASLLAQLELSFAAGSSALIPTDSTWLVSTGPILRSDIYTGEVQDTRISPGHWLPAVRSNYPTGNLVPTTCEPTTEQETFPPIKIFTSPNGERLIDFGQNISGWVRIRLRGRAGDTIRIAHAESLDPAGNFYTGNLRDAKATDEYILNGTLQTLQPHFTYHGFRYAKIRGFTATPENCEAVAVHSNLRHTGSFECSDKPINRLQKNIEWSLNDNFLDIPTDCPQRSERLGWTGDAQVFCRTAAFNRDIKKFFSKWLADLAADQGANGAVPSIIPDLYGHANKGDKHGYAGWGDAATIIPWTIYELYGDTAILLRQFESMKAWVEYIRSSSKGLLWTANGYGDWYAPGPRTPLPFIDECFFAHSTELVIRAAHVLHMTGDEEFYSVLLKNIRTVFLRNYADSLPDTQTAYALALHFNLLPDSLRPGIAARLVTLIHQNNDHLATGFLGTPYLLQVLSDNGYTDLAYKILNQTTLPSWLYPITRGATTIWEKWDAIRPDNSFDTCSLNHYAYGAVGDWFYETIAGIRPAAPGYKKILIAPHPGGGLTWVKCSYQCPYGRIISNWRRSGNRLILKVSIPPGTTATVLFPGSGNNSHELGPGDYHFDIPFL